jgi:hypothetical protein
MAKYLLIESRNPWESGDVAYLYGLARDLAGSDNEVTLFLVQNGVMPVRKGAKDSGLAELTGKLTILADGFSLRERAIGPEALIAGVAVSDVDAVVDLLASGAKAIWH